MAGLPPAQQADMDLLLAGRWPALKPLPVFRYEGEDHRATIHFDKTRGEWVCRKTSLLVNKAQEVPKDLELRGGLTELTMALPHGKAEALSEDVAVEETKLESEDKLHLQAVLAWRENYRNGTVYSGLQNYLSDRQQEEVYDIVRTSLTAWQLQFNPKNIAFIFDVLCNAGGRLAALIEIAQLRRAEWVAGTRSKEILPPKSTEEKNADRNFEIKPQQSVLPVPASACTSSDDTEVSHSLAARVASEPTEHYAPYSTEIDIPKVGESPTPEHVGSFISTTHESFATEPIENSYSEHFETASPGQIAQSRPESSEVMESENVGVSAWPLSSIFREKTSYNIPLFGFRMPSATTKAESSPRGVEDSSSQLFVPGKSAKKGVGLRITAMVFLIVGFTIGFIVGLNTPAIPPATEESNSGQPSSTARPADSATPVRPIGPVSAVMSPSHVDSDNSSGAQKRDDATAVEEKSKENGRDSETLAQVPSKDSTLSPAIESEHTPNPEASENRGDSRRPITRNASPPVLPEPIHSGKAGDSIPSTTRDAVRGSTSGTTKAQKVAAAPGQLAPLRSSSSSAILVTAPAEGSRSLKLTFPEKPIAVSSSFAISSQFSVLIAPEPGPAVTHHPARLQAGKLISYVWPHYPKPGSRGESTETVKVLATIGRLGQVMDVKRVNGSSSLFAAATSAVRQWHFQPTLLNERPVQALQNVTIEFRPPRSTSQVRTRVSPN